MSFSINDYTHIPSSGILPDTLVPADQISFAYTFTYEKYIDLSGPNPVPLDGRVVIELKDSAGNLKATFDLRESYTIFLFPGGYTWNWYSNKEQFSATDAQGNPISTEEKFSLGVMPAQGYGVVTTTATVDSTFYSYIFDIDVDEGDILKIKFHNLSAGTVIDQASLGVATHPGGSTTPALVDGRCGQQFRVATTGQKTRMVRSRRLDSPLDLAQTEWTQGDDGLVFDKALNGAQIAQTDGNTLYVVGTSKDQLLLFRSQNEGKTWQQIMSETTNLKILAAHLARGGRYLIYGTGADKKPAYAILKHGQDQWTLSETGPCTLAAPTSPSTPVPLPTSKVSALEEGEGGALRLLATDKDGTLLVWLSRDGKEWQQTTAT